VFEQRDTTFTSIQLFGLESLLYCDRTAVQLRDSLYSQIKYYQRGIVQLHKSPSNTAITGSLFTQSAATDAGGALYLIDSFANINRNSFIDLEAQTYGGAIYADLTPDFYTKLVKQNAALLSSDSMSDLNQTLRNPNVTFSENSVVRCKADIGSVGYY
jgi:hypothetical protein